jgi:SAM-dependent methyltransferase
MSARRDDILRTFGARAPQYDQESGWVTADRLISPLVPEAPKERDRAVFMDLCTGSGRVALKAIAMGWTTVAVDRSPEMLRRLVSDCALRVVADAEDLPCSDNSAEVVAVRQALHYFDGTTVLREMCRVARREIRLGHITLYDEADTDWWMKYFAIASPGRRRVFAPGEQVKLLESLGLTVITTTVLESEESFDGPIAHLPPDERVAIQALLDDAPTALRVRHALREHGAAETIKLRWEFTCALL